MKRSRAPKGLIASRMAFGIAIWTLPGPVGKAFGVDMTRDPLAVCMVCDAADTLAAGAAGRNGLSCFVRARVEPDLRRGEIKSPSLTTCPR